MDETESLASAALAADDPVINVIEPEPPRDSGSTRGGGGDVLRLDHTAREAVAARRRREFDAARARLREQAIRADRDLARSGVLHLPESSSEPPQRNVPQHQAAGRAPLDQPPERIRKRYLRAGNQYFLKDAPHALAFEDIGPYLVTEHNRPDIVESMVDMVQAKAWARIRVSGHDAFRREVWVQASLLGIEVGGYEPKAVDLARLAEGRRARMHNRIDADVSSSEATSGRDTGEAEQVQLRVPPVQDGAAQRSTPQTPASQPSSEFLPSAAAQHPTKSHTGEGEPSERQRYIGELVEHGGAPYQHNPARSASYYAVYRDRAGTDHVVWGVDLERAVAESGATPGQQVRLENLGRQLVTVKVPVVNDAGEMIGEEEKGVYRNTWQVDVVGRARTQGSPVSLMQEDADRGEVRSPRDEVDRDTAASLTASENRAMQLAVLTAAMREQGFSDRSIARVQQRAQSMLDAFDAGGVTVPQPRVFDPKAPAARNRRARPAPSPTPMREVERAPTVPLPPER